MIMYIYQQKSNGARSSAGSTPAGLVDIPADVLNVNNRKPLNNAQIICCSCSLNRNVKLDC